MSEAIEITARRAGPPDESEMRLELTVNDPEVCAELLAHEDGRPRTEFALGALRIGVLTLRQAQGRIDAQQVRAEGKHLVENLGAVLSEHSGQITERITNSLKDYFDPDSGRLNERLNRLVQRDGELEELLRRQVGTDGSEMARTLAEHVGSGSELMKVLSPEQSSGLLAQISASVEGTLADQRDRILSQFSLDNKESALSRLLSELADRHGQLGTAVRERLDAVVDEFSLDKDDSALSRLVRRVETTQTKISDEFSLDEEDSALARLRREIVGLLETQRKQNSEFREEVKIALAAMNARKTEAKRGTRQGLTFEDEVYSFIQGRSQGAGDVATPTGSTTGVIRNCKVGDAVVELGMESAAPGAKIVVEAKDKAGYSTKDALDELDVARKNRDAAVGLFVFSSRTAPEGVETLVRYGNDVIVVWDATNPDSDVVFSAGLSVARALCTAKSKTTSESVDWEVIERAIREIEKQANGLGEITKFTETIKSNSDKILKRTRIIRDSVERQIENLDDTVGQVRALLAPADRHDGLAPDKE